MATLTDTINKTLADVSATVSSTIDTVSKNAEPAMASITETVNSTIASMTGDAEPKGPLAMTYIKQAQQEFKPPLIANENAFLGDLATSTDTGKPISCGLYRLEKGTPLVYKYTYHEMKMIVDGHFHITDETGQTVTGTRGDVFYFPKGSTITFTTDDFGLGFYVGQRAKDTA